MTERPPFEAQSFTSRISMWSARHRKVIAIAWVLIVIAALAAVSTIETDTSVEQVAPGETGEATKLLEERFGETEDIPTEFVVFSHPSLTVDDEAYRETVEGLMAEVRALRVVKTESAGGTAVTSSTRVVSAITTHYDLGAPRELSPYVAANAASGDVTFAIVELEGEFEDAVDNIDTVLETVDEFEAPAGFEILIGGTASLQQQLDEIIEEDFGQALFLNLPITFVVLILAFGALLVASVPLVLAFAAIITANGLLAIISQSYALSEASELVLLLGLATGIDYALFVITRFRRELAAGLSKEDALRAASGTSGKAVVFAGATVVLSLAGLFLVDDVIFTTLALASIVVVLLAIVISVTLLPALLALLGDNVNRWRVPFIGGGGTGEGGGIWGVITDQVLARPAIWATTALVALLALASPIFYPGFNLGFNGVKSFPDDAEGKKALIALEENFVLGLAQPAFVIVDAGEKGNVFAADIQASADALLSSVEQESFLAAPDAFYGEIAQEPEFSDAGDTELLFIPINADAGDDRAIDAVNHLRDDLIPAAFGDEGSARALVAGATAANIDFKDNILAKAPLVFAFVLGLAFLVLLVMFRSIVIPIKAILLNLLSVGAAYGVLVLVFQEGWLLQGVLDFEATGIVESFIPLFLFAILFGLSMDYHMFVLARIKEAYENGSSNDEAVSIGIKATAGTITSAAAIMVAVFSIFAFMRVIGIKQFGVGLGVAILIDATVIRSILLPASMKLLGDANWYLPRWLQWLPEINMAE